MDVRASQRIRRPVAEVFSYISDPSNDPEWISGIVSAEMVTEPPTGLGARVKRTARFLAKRIDYILEITAYQPNRLIAMRSVQGPFPMEVDYVFQEIGSETDLEIRIGGDATGFFRLAAPLLEFQVRKSLRKDVAAIRDVLEAGIISG